MIEAAGLKGTRVGAAEIAQKHANDIVNLGGAGSEDAGLVDIARERVFKEFGIQLELEVQIMKDSTFLNFIPCTSFSPGGA